MFVYQLVKWASEERGDTPSTPQISSPSEPAVDHELQQRFDSAAAFVRTVTDRISQLDLLYLYARYKQATVGKAGNYFYLFCLVTFLVVRHSDFLLKTSKVLLHVAVIF